MFNLHKDFSFKLELVGAKQQPVLIVKYFLDRSDLLVDFYCHHMAFNLAENISMSREE